MSGRPVRRALAGLALCLNFLSFALFSAGAAQAQSAPSPYTSATRYDLAGRVTGTIGVDPDGAGAVGRLAERRTYDANGWLIAVESGVLADWQGESVAPADWAGFTRSRRVESLYDASGRKLRDTLITGPAASAMVESVTQYSYDALDRSVCTAVRMNPNVYASLPADACMPGPAGSYGGDRITRTLYDSAGRVSVVQKAVGTPLQQDYVAYTYTANGNQASVTDANGATASFSYDEHDRRIRWNFPSKVTAGLASDSDYEAYTYDTSGNRTSVRKRDGSIISFTYDALDRLTQKTVPERAGLAAIHSRDVYYGYDNRGLQLYARFDSHSGEGVASVYDNLGRLSATTTTLGGTARTLSYAHDAGGNRTEIIYPGGLRFEYRYNSANQPTEVIDWGNGYGITGFYYDSLSRPFVRVSHYGAHSVYYYDNASRLYFQSLVFVGGAGDIQRTFSYSPANQIVSRTLSNDAYAYTGDVDVSRSYTANGLNQYTSAGPATFTYDPNGNLTGDGANIYQYDVENRLVSRSGAANATLTYDPLGRLFEAAGSSAGTTRFLYDGDELVAEYDTAGTLLRRYVHGPGTDDPLAWYEGAGLSDRRYYHSDERGSITSLVGPDSRLRQINSYDAYGIPAPTNEGRFGYTGQLWLPELGMWYYKARIYSPTLGRFMQTDPIGYEDQINLYAYVGNDPVNASDPDGQVTIGNCEGDAKGNVSSSCSGANVVSAGNAYEAQQANAGGSSSARTGRLGAGSLTDPAGALRAAEIAQLDAQIQILSPGTPTGLRMPGSNSATLLNSLREQVVSLRSRPLANNAEARSVANALGFTEFKGAGSSKGQAIFTNGKIFITRDIPRGSTGRTDNGGVWKAATSVDGLSRAGKLQGQRMTLDRGLGRIGR